MVKKLELGFTAEVTTPPSPPFVLHAAHPVPHTHRRVRVKQVEAERPLNWKTLLAYITGTVDQELLLRNAYLVTDNRILRHQIKGRLRLSDGERKVENGSAGC